MTKLVLACHIYIDDGWYGDNHRILLSKSSTEGFRNRTEAKKYLVRLREYAQQRFSKPEVNPITNDNIKCGPHDSFESYRYVSAGPAESYTHHEITTEDLTD